MSALPSYSSFIEGHLQQSAETKFALKQLSSQIEKICFALIDTSASGGTIYSCGNGGSTCDAMHLSEELVARYKRERPGIRAQHLCDSSAITCWANDYSFGEVFERQVKTLISPKDALIGFSTSGNSENIIRAVQAANEIGALTVAFTGKTGGKLKTMAKLSVVVPSNETAHIQEAHIALVHIVCDVLEQALFP